MAQLPPIKAWPFPKQGQPYGPAGWQKDLFIYHFDPKDRPHNHTADVCLLIGGAGSGKCFKRGTGFILQDLTIKNVEDLIVGDSLLGPDGDPRRITSVSRGRERMYRIVPVKGDPWECNESHILSLKITNQGVDKRIRKDGSIYIKPPRYGGQEVVNVSVKEYLSWSKRKRKAYKLYRAEAIERTSKDLTTLPPYILGSWLGDGHKVDMSISCMDSEIINEWNIFANSLGKDLNKKYSGSSCPKYNIPGEVGRLRKYNLRENKHIPAEYMDSSICQRLELLAGLLDTDGHYQNRGHFEIIQKRKRLAEDITFLCRSLGLAAYMKPCKKSCTYKGEKREGTYYRIHISGDLDKIPCRVERKKATPRRQIKNHLVTGFEVEALEEGEYCGFTLEGPDRLCLMSDFTVVHNTVAGMAQIIELLVKFPGCQAAVGGKNYPLLKRNVINEFGRRFSAFDEDWDHPIIKKKPTQNEQTARLISFYDPRLKANVFSTLTFINLDKFEVARGFNADVILIEEVNLMSGDSFEEMIRRSRGRILPVRQFILTMNPTGDRDWVFTKFNLRQWEPTYDGPPIPIGKPCTCHLCQACLNNDKGEFVWEGGTQLRSNYVDRDGVLIPNRLYSWTGGKCPNCGAKKGTSCPGEQHWYRVIRSRSADNIHNPDSYVQDMKASMDPEMFRSYVLGEIIQLRKGKAYKSWSNDNILPKDIPLNYEKDLIWTHDFNLNPMCSVIWQEGEGGIHVVDEIIKWDGTAEVVAAEFVKRYKHFKGKILIYGDPAGLNAGRSESRRNEFQIIYDYLSKYKLNVEICMKKIPGETKIGIRDRISNVNVMLKNASGEIRVRINPSCEGIINSLSTVSWDENGKEEDDNIDDLAVQDPNRDTNPPPMTHPACALGYAIYKRFPLIEKLSPAAIMVTKDAIRNKEKGSEESISVRDPEETQQQDTPELLSSPVVTYRSPKSASIPGMGINIGNSVLRERLKKEKEERERLEAERIRKIQENLGD